ncbi:hypothetical protein VTI28DRAFT_753 [Corynascus sepedonium]
MPIGDILGVGEQRPVNGCTIGRCLVIVADDCTSFRPASSDTRERILALWPQLSRRAEVGERRQPPRRWFVGRGLIGSNRVFADLKVPWDADYCELG